jgi:hypothetical protein
MIDAFDMFAFVVFGVLLVAAVMVNHRRGRKGRHETRHRDAAVKGAMLAVRGGRGRCLCCSPRPQWVAREVRPASVARAW